MAVLKQSTAYTRSFKMIDSADHLSAKTGLTPTVNISKAGAAFGAAAGAVSAIGNGWYNVALTTADTNTAGDLAFYITASGADDTDFVDQVVTALTDDIFSRLGAPVGASISADVAEVQSDTNDIQTRIPAALVSGRMDAVVGAMTESVSNYIADALLDRDMASGTDSGSTTVRTVRQALRFLRNKWAISAGTLTVYKENDATASWTSTLSTSAGDPVSSSDPAGP